MSDGLPPAEQQTRPSSFNSLRKAKPPIGEVDEEWIRHVARLPVQALCAIETRPAFKLSAIDCKIGASPSKGHCPSAANIDPP
mmetsp:Transcript_58828/g.155722  ORF Transcript_58828/g.155722 Transcript_58828/m.155722 type:complete len:83 (-) Transcript_58828:462-710(-)